LLTVLSKYEILWYILKKLTVFGIGKTAKNEGFKMTFQNIFPKLLKTFNFFDFSLRRDPFRLQINLNLSENLKIFLTSFPKFDIKFSAFHRKKIKKQNQNQKETRKKKT
jgi:hypothetical protein